MVKPSITEQREAVEALINCALEDEQPVPSTIEKAKQAVLTLGMLERNPDLARVIAVVMREFPGSEVEVR